MDRSKETPEKEPITERQPAQPHPVQRQPVPPAAVRAVMGYSPDPSAPGKVVSADAVHDSSVKKVDSAHSPQGAMGQTYLGSGKAVSMRLWEEPAGVEGIEHSRAYETVGYVLEGRAELHLEGQLVTLGPGDSWVVPRNARHRYRIVEGFRAVEATAPPAAVHSRDEAWNSGASSA